MVLVTVLVLCGLLLLWIFYAFNRFVRMRHRVREAFSGVDVQLRRRHDLVPNLVATVGAYARHEEQALSLVTAARTQAIGAEGVEDRAEAEAGLVNGLGRLLLLVEQYPELKADEGFRRLQDQLVEIEDDLQYARRYYNATVRELNIRIEQVPSNVVAGLFGMRAEPYFEVDAVEVRAVPGVSLDEEG